MQPSTKMRQNPTAKEEFRDMLATSDVRRLIAAAIRNERQCPSISAGEVCMFERLRDGLRSTNEAFAKHKEGVAA